MTKLIVALHSFVNASKNCKTLTQSTAYPGVRAVQDGHSIAGIAGSNFTESMDVRLLCCVLCR
jgi:hypothetical protein